MESAEVVGLKKDIEYISRTVSEIKADLHEMKGNYVRKELLASSLKEANDYTKSVEERVKRLEVIIYGMIGLILTAFFGALITFVFKK